MNSLIRKYQQPALIALTVLVIVLFVGFWNGNTGSRMGFGSVNKRAVIYGNAVTQTDLDRIARKFDLAVGLGLSDLVESLSVGAENEQQALNAFIINTYVFDHEADALQISPSDAEVQQAITELPIFQTGGKFDPLKLTNFVQDKLPSLGFTDTVIDELVREQVRVQKVRDLIAAGVNATPSELKNRFELLSETMNVSVVRLNESDVEKGIDISDADAQSAYDQHKEAYRSEDERKVMLASFELTDTQKALTGKERTAALQKCADDAESFNEAIIDKSSEFETQAKKDNIPLTTTGYFSANQPDPSLSKVSALPAAAFGLDAKNPTSDVVDGPNGYYVVHLVDTQPGHQLTFLEAKPQIIAQLRKDRAAQLMQTRATDIRTQLLAAMKAGKSFADAAKTVGMTAQDVPQFSLQQASKVDVPDAQTIIQSALALNVGQLSDFASTASGGLFIYMANRKEPDGASAAIGEEIMKDQLNRQTQMEAFAEWLRGRKEEAHIQVFARS